MYAKQHTGLQSGTFRKMSATKHKYCLYLFLSTKYDLLLLYNLISILVSLIYRKQ